MKIIIELLRFLNIIPVPFMDVQPRICLARAIIEANRLKVFQTIGSSSNGATSSEIRSRTGQDLEALEALLHALSCNGYIHERRGRFVNSRWVKRWILDEHTGMPTFLSFQTSLWNRLTSLDHVLRTGQPKIDYHQEEGGVASQNQELYTRAMREVSKRLIPPLLRSVKLPDNASRMLDIGGAHGDYARAFASKFQNLSVVVLDLPGPASTGSSMSAENDRVEFQSGNIFNTNLKPEWDIILLSNMVHLFNSKLVNDLVSHCAAGLRPGGTLIIMDQFLGVRRIQESIASLVSLAYLTVGGKSYSREEMMRFFSSAGLSRITCRPFLLQAPTAVFQAWK